MSSIDRRRADAISSTRIRHRYGRFAAAIALGDEIYREAMNLVRHFEHMVIGYFAFGRVAVEQRRLCVATNHQREFPGNIGRIHERRVQPSH